MARLLGIFWLLFGIVWLIRPDILKNRLKRKMSRRIRWTIYGFLFFFGLIMIGSLIKAEGLLPKIIGILGVILVIKSTLLFLSKTSDRLWKWWAEQPLMIFRLQALIIIIVGAMLVKV
ncbi:MAG: hypothetical protein JW800_04140 [Candidatus Omnitrophica bacterium]|nr:hypothetical protein [Candidatus Omnitrophota bacterium]